MSDENTAVRFLNRIYGADREAVEALFRYRVPCNKVLAEDPTAQVRCDQGVAGCSIGLIGVINGLLGDLELPLVAAQFEKLSVDGRDGLSLVGFQLYKDSEKVSAPVEP